MVANIERVAFFESKVDWRFRKRGLNECLYSVKVVRELGSTFKKYAKWLH